MVKFKKLKRNKYFEFALDESMEFAEFFKMVIEHKNKLTFIYKNKDFGNTENLQENVKQYYVTQRGFKQVIFLKHFYHVT